MPVMGPDGKPVATKPLGPSAGLRAPRPTPVGTPAAPAGVFGKPKPGKGFGKPKPMNQTPGRDRNGDGKMDGPGGQVYTRPPKIGMVVAPKPVAGKDRNKDGKMDGPGGQRYRQVLPPVGRDRNGDGKVDGPGGKRYKPPTKAAASRMSQAAQLRMKNESAQAAATRVKKPI